MSENVRSASIVCDKRPNAPDSDRSRPNCTPADRPETRACAQPGHCSRLPRMHEQARGYTTKTPTPSLRLTRRIDPPQVDHQCDRVRMSMVASRVSLRAHLHPSQGRNDRAGRELWRVRKNPDFRRMKAGTGARSPARSTHRQVVRDQRGSHSKAYDPFARLPFLTPDADCSPTRAPTTIAAWPVMRFRRTPARCVSRWE
jgi:hypothetical protein